METKSQRLKRRNDALPSLDAAIGALDLARRTANAVPIEDLFRSASVLLNTIKVRLHLVHSVQLLAHERRNRWEKKRTMWNWGWFALIFVKLLTGGRASLSKPSQR